MNFSIHANFLFLELCITLCKQILYNSIILQQLRQEFGTALGNAVMVTHAEDESEPSTSMNTESYDTSPPKSTTDSSSTYGGLCKINDGGGRKIHFRQ